MDASQCRVIRVKGIPPKATATDVVRFFEGLELDERCIYLHTKERRGAGEVRCPPCIPMPRLSPAQCPPRPRS